MELDLLDKKILNSLNENVKSHYLEIAKKVNSSKEVVAYRIKRLIDQGFIKEFVTIYNFGYWSNKILLNFSKIDSQKEEEILKFLVHHKDVNWVTPASGNCDLIFSVMAKDPKEFDTILRSIFEVIGKNVSSYKVGTSVGSHTFGHTYILDSIKETKETINKEPVLDFDQKDKQIAKVLHSNARAKIIDISLQTNIPVDTVSYRIKKLEKNNVIKRYRMILDAQKLGYNRYEIFLRCVNLSDSTLKKIYSFAKNTPNIEYYSKCVGSWDIEFTVHYKTHYELRSFILKLKEEFGDIIESFETSILFETQNYIYFPEELR